MEPTGRVFEIREFCLHDGPGPRTTVFLQGCPLRCTWCQNPEGQTDAAFAPSSDGEEALPAAGASVNWTVRTLGVDEAVAEIMKTADFLLASGGGVTFSGGEPLRQSDFVCAVSDRLKAPTGADGARTGGLHLALETSGFADAADYRRVVARMDLVYQDLKHPDRDAHRHWTGVDPEPIWRNLAWLRRSGVPFVVRVPLIPGVNDTPEAKAGFARMLAGAENLLRVELLPYNRLAGAKYARLGKVYAPGFDENAAVDTDAAAFAAQGIPCVAL